MRMVGTAQEPDLAFLPWDTPLEEWPEDLVVALPRGISRHIVRFVRLNGIVYAIKEAEYELVEREYNLLGELQRRAVPCVEPVGTVSDRSDLHGEALPLRTDHQTLAVFAPVSSALLFKSEGRNSGPAARRSRTPIGAITSHWFFLE